MSDLKTEMENKIIHRFNVNSMSETNFNEFKTSAAEEFGGNYAMKIMHDHNFVKYNRDVPNILQDILNATLELKESLKQEPQEEPEKIRTFGRGE